MAALNLSAPEERVEPEPSVVSERQGQRQSERDREAWQADTQTDRHTGTQAHRHTDGGYRPKPSALCPPLRPTIRSYSLIAHAVLCPVRALVLSPRSVITTASCLLRCACPGSRLDEEDLRILILNCDNECLARFPARVPTRRGVHPGWHPRGGHPSAWSDGATGRAGGRGDALEQVMRTRHR